jgi:transcriptional regulator with XRE-family HTH domain
VVSGDEVRGELESRWRDLGEFIREQRNLGQLSLRKLSEQAGVSNPYLSQIERGVRKPSAEILRQIARALEISSEELYVRAGILDERTDQPGVGGAIRADRHLTEEQKKTLLSVYQSFCQQNGVPDDEIAEPEELPEGDGPDPAG